MNEQDTPVEAPEGPPEGSPAPEGSEPKGNREARYRVERNEARAALTAAEERVARLQTAEAYRLAREAGLSVGADLMLAGVELSELLTEDGLVSVEAVTEAAKAVLAERPQLRKLDRATDPSQGLGGQQKKPELSWSNALNG
jgi:hypothetical protein